MRLGPGIASLLLSYVVKFDPSSRKIKPGHVVGRPVALQRARDQSFSIFAELACEMQKDYTRPRTCSRSVSVCEHRVTVYSCEHSHDPLLLLGS